MKKRITLLEAIQIDTEKHKIIAVVGAGGKTTLIYTLALELKKTGKKVVVTTTTHMIPKDCEGIITIGVPCKDSEKIKGLGEKEFDELKTTYDIILVEADGSHKLPMKVPESYEPVIPKDADLVIGILGAAAIGHPLYKVCQRYQLAEEILKVKKEHIVTAEDLVMLLKSKQGQKKNVTTDYRMVVGQGDLLKKKVVSKDIVVLSFGKRVEECEHEN